MLYGEEKHRTWVSLGIRGGLEMLQIKIKMQDFPVGKCRLAYTFAKYCHSEMNQKRKGSNEPYFVHPKGVAKIVMDNEGNEDQIIAAFYHDLLEDVPFVSYEELRKGFGHHVADLVVELTNSRYKIEEMGKEDYMTEKLMKLSNEALLIKLADMLYNINDMATEAQEVRMLHNVSALIRDRKDLTDNTRRLAMMVFGS